MALFALALAPRPLRRWAPRLGLLLWGVGTVVLCAYLLAAHLVTLPKPPVNEPRLREAIARSHGPGAGGRWAAMHVLYRGCRCSGRVFDHLLARGPAAGYVETIVFVGDAGEGGGDEEARAKAAGFGFEPVAAEALGSIYGVEAVPLLVVASPSGELRYVGGYSDRKQGPVARDARALATLAEGGAVEALPVFGCPVSERLRAAVDPFGLR